MISISFAAERPTDADVLAFIVREGANVAETVGGDLGGVAQAAATSARFTGKAGEMAELHGSLDGTVRRVLLVGAGEAGPADGGADKAGGALVAKLLASGVRRLVVDVSAIEGDRARFSALLAQAAVLRGWHFHAYRTKLPEAQKPTLSEIVIVAGDAAEAARAAWEPLRAVAEGVAFTRGLVTEPANILYPESFVERCRELEALGITIDVLGEAAMAEAGMGALLGVSQGSEREAQLLVMRWDGTGGQGDPIAFVGKGVTFDTGGISLKQPAGMEDMKWDMGGAGAVAGFMKAIAGRKAKANVIAVCGLVENMPDGRAQRPGDVVTSMSGQTIEVINTDAEGRLVLSDAIWWVQQNYRPKTIVDLATLTGAMIVSLGHEHGGIFANDDGLAEALLAAGTATGEKLWRMPLGDAYDKMIDSPIADMKNVGPREAGPITAAQFIKRFVEDGVRWAHLDIAGMVWAGKPGTWFEKGATGYGVRLLDRFLADHVER